MADAAFITDPRPWMIRDRAPGAMPERRWPKVKWWDDIPVRVWRRLFPATARLYAGDWRFAERVMRLGEKAARLDDAALLNRAVELRPLLLREGFDGMAAVRAFALAREATRRTLGFAHHPVQIIGARQILDGRIVEMATGEGKTATTVLAAAAAALAGMRVHVVTVNEYLRERDFETLEPIYARLGITAAQVDPEADPRAKQQAYRCPVVHVTNKTLVFDYLRSRLDRPGLASVQRHAAGRLTDEASGGGGTPPGLCFAIVDEADSVLIDEAQTPLIIAAQEASHSADDCKLALAFAETLAAPQHYRIVQAERRIELTASGKAAAANGLDGNGGIWRIPAAREDMVSTALSALHLHDRDGHYIVIDDKVQIVDEFTGRVLEDRQWQAGLHQMIEVKEGIEQSAARRTMAQLTFQQFFRRYLWFGGMSGTIREVARETRRVYDRKTVAVPTNRPVRRRNLGTTFLGSERRKIEAIRQQVARLSGRGRPVLIGTRSVETSERLSRSLAERGIAHRVLNARQDGDEAAIISEAGESGAITIATNMAGRGTDIKLSPGARQAGGLHVILTEFHESRRIDRQLFGRAGRQGDPGSVETIVSLEDGVLQRFGGGACRLVAATALGRRGRIPAIWAGILRRIAQGRAERLATRNRVNVLRRSEKLESLLGFAVDRSG